MKFNIAYNKNNDKVNIFEIFFSASIYSEAPVILNILLF